MGEKVIATVDNVKKARLLLLALVITVSLFIIRSWELIDINSNEQVFALGVGYFILTFVGLLLAFKFQVNRRSFFFVLPQSAFFVSSEVLFVSMFFFRSFERVFDFLFLLILLLIILFATYVIFLMANVLNVATFKPLPLMQVATTSSYLATTLMIFFISFAFASLSVNILIMLSVMLFFYVQILIFQYYQIENTLKDSMGNAIITGSTAVFAMSMGLIMGPHHELSALIPASVVFGFIGLEMAEKKSQIKLSLLIQYVFVIIAAFLINVFFNIA